MRRFPVICFCLALLCTTSWALEPKWMRYPAISPDGTKIAFSFAGDIYVVESDGGLALPLTHGDAHETTPVWSHNGEFLAYASNRYGNYDVFIMPGGGGPAQRLTVHSSDDFPQSFTAKDSDVLFTSLRMDHHQSIQFPNGRHPELYTIPRNGGRPALLNSVSTEHAVIDRNGRYLLYEYKRGIENKFRKHQTSDASYDLWLWDMKKDTYRAVTNFKGEERNPVFSADGNTMFYLSEANGTQNVYKKALHESKRSSVEQLTEFATHPVRHLSIADNGTLAFGYHGAIYTLVPGQNNQPQKVLIDIPRDSLALPLYEQSLAGKISEFAISPDGKEVAFIVRGEVFVASVAEGTLRRITETPEQERSVSFHPEGRKLLYAGERNGSWNLYETALVHDEEKYFFNATQLEEKLLLSNGEETFQPSYSPDGSEVAFLENRTQLRVLNLESKAVRDIGSFTKHFSYSDGDQHFEWSPDGKWFLLEFIENSHWSGEVGLIAADGKGDYINLSQNGFNDMHAQWVREGQQIIWRSSRDGMRDFASTGSTQSDVYSLFMTEKAWDRYNMTEEELTLFEAREKEAEGAKKAESKEEAKDKGKDQDKTKAKPELEIDWDGIEDRKARLTIHSAEIAGATVTPDGKKLLYLAKFEGEYNLWVTDLYSKETKILTTLNAHRAEMALTKDGKQVVVLANGSLRVITIEGGKAEGISVNGSFLVDRSAERAYVFEHVWRQVRERFYVEDLHGAAWDSLKPDYAEVLPHITHTFDFADFLSELLGELNASHTGAKDFSRPQPADDTASLAVFYDYSHDGAGLKIADIVSGGPIDEVTPKVATGSVITAVNGKTIAANQHIYSHLNHAAGKPLRLTIQEPKAKTTRDIIVKPIGQRQAWELVYERWVEGRRAATEKLSDGKVGYVHVRNMSDDSYRTVFEEVFSKAVDKQALVVDTRFNGGGDLVDDLSTFLNGEQYMLFETRDGRIIGSEPQRKWRKPSVVLMSEGNYSDAHCFPFAYKTLGLGKLIGTQVAGTCTFVWWERTQDPDIVFGIPNLTVTNQEGKALENLDLDPDIYVQNQPKDINSGKDAQLERAVQEMLSTIQ